MAFNVFGSDKKTSNVSTSYSDSLNTTLTNTYTFDSSGQQFDAGSPSLAINYAMPGASIMAGTTSLTTWLPWIGAVVLLFFGWKLWKG
jgi:hypothetical protein